MSGARAASLAPADAYICRAGPGHLMISMSNHSLGDSKAIWVPDAWHSERRTRPPSGKDPSYLCREWCQLTFALASREARRLKNRQSKYSETLEKCWRLAVQVADVAKVTVFLTESSMAARMNTVYARFFSVP